MENEHRRAGARFRILFSGFQASRETCQQYFDDVFIYLFFSVSEFSGEKNTLSSTLPPFYGSNKRLTVLGIEGKKACVSIIFAWDVYNNLPAILTLSYVHFVSTR